MNDSITILRAIVLVLACATVQSPARADPSPQCFTPAELAARPGEEHVTKGIRTFDAPPTATTLAPAAIVPPELRGAIRRVELPKGSKLVALTFDLCEQPGEVAGYDGAIFDYLRANHIKATLFTGGKWMRSHAERFRQLLSDPLFEIANHSEAHRNLRLLSGAALDNEIMGPERAYEQARAAAAGNQCLAPRLAGTPARMRLFRFPYGACNPAAMQAVNDAGLLAIQWDLSTGDPSPGTSATEIANALVRGTKPGSIIISHANGRGWHTAAGLPQALPKLIAAGYRFVTVSELLAAGKPVVVTSCYDSRPGDTDRYDHPLALAVKSRAAAPRQPQSGGIWDSWFTTVQPSERPASKRVRPEPATSQ